MSTPREIQLGDCLSSIAFETGFSTQTLWDHPDNAALRETRSSPHVLQPGDVVMIPPVEPKSEPCATGRRHVFRRKGVPARLSVRLLLRGKPRVSTPYVIVLGNGRRFEGTTDADGNLHQFVPPDARQATLILGEGTQREERFELGLGTLTPESDSAGVASRLVNLGLLEEAKKSDRDAIAAVLRLFQRNNDLTVTGTPDDTTRAKLRDANGS